MKLINFLKREKDEPRGRGCQYEILYIIITEASLVAQSVLENPPANAGDLSLMPKSGRSPGERNGNPLLYSSLGNPKVRGVLGVTRADTN